MPSLAGGQTGAIRVRINNAAQFPSAEGSYFWVGPAVEMQEPLGSTYFVAPLQCEPYFADWSGIDVLHVYGAEVVPDTTYEVEVVRDGGAIDCASEQLMVTTGKWGDVVAPFGGGSRSSFAVARASRDRRGPVRKVNLLWNAVWVHR